VALGARSPRRRYLVALEVPAPNALNAPNAPNAPSLFRLHMQ
jgi:hypothetical protein